MFPSALHRSIGLLLGPLRLVLPFWRRLRRFRRPDSPPDPYAGVRAPKWPLRPTRSASVALEEPD